MINHRELGRRLQLDGAGATCQHVSEALASGDLTPNDFSIRDLAVNLVENGYEWVESMNPVRGGLSIRESDAVDSTAFANITGQIIYNTILMAYQNEAFVFSMLVDTIPTRLDGEKIPGMSRIGDEAEVVGEGMPFPNKGFGEDYIETPSTVKRGLIVPVTKEAIFFDRTGLILRRAAEVGEFLGVNKEKRLVDIAAGITNSYKWNGTMYNTYQTSSPWINEIAANELVDWTDVDAAEQLFADMLDPYTSEPIVLNDSNMSLVTTPAYNHAARRILRATSIEHVDNQAAAGTIRTHSGNPLNPYRHYQSRQLYRRIVASGEAAADAKMWWFLGDFKKAFAYMENWPITVVQAPNNSEAEFTSDIVTRYKASERGTPAVLDPRYVVKCTG